MVRLIWITTQFVGFHRWKDAPPKFAYLSQWHRHVFHVKLWMPVEHNNRDIEFIDFKFRVDRYLQRFENQRFEYSCEEIAEIILNNFNAYAVSVSEDGENGVWVCNAEDWDLEGIHKKLENIQ